ARRVGPVRHNGYRELGRRGSCPRHGRLVPGSSTVNERHVLRQQLTTVQRNTAPRGLLVPRPLTSPAALARGKTSACMHITAGSVTLVAGLPNEERHFVETTSDINWARPALPVGT